MHSPLYGHTPLPSPPKLNLDEVTLSSNAGDEFFMIKTLSSKLLHVQKIGSYSTVSFISNYCPFQ